MPAATAVAEPIAGAEELWADVVIASGRGGDEVTRLRRASEAQPHREVRWRQLVAALAAAGRRAEGLRAVGEARRALAEFGLLPGYRPPRPRAPAPRDRRRAPTARRADPDPPGSDGRAGTPSWPTCCGPCPSSGSRASRAPGKTRLLAEVADRDTTGDGDADAVLLYAACPRTLGSGSPRHVGAGRDGPRARAGDRATAGRAGALARSGRRPRRCAGPALRSRRGASGPRRGVPSRGCGPPAPGAPSS